MKISEALKEAYEILKENNIPLKKNRKLRERMKTLKII